LDICREITNAFSNRPRLSCGDCLITSLQDAHARPETDGRFFLRILRGFSLDCDHAKKQASAMRKFAAVTPPVAVFPRNYPENLLLPIRCILVPAHGLNIH
jgi:hypothetical protein